MLDWIIQGFMTVLPEKAQWGCAAFFAVVILALALFVWLR
jgi:hypothetical protein